MPVVPFVSESKHNFSDGRILSNLLWVLVGVGELAWFRGKSPPNDRKWKVKLDEVSQKHSLHFCATKAVVEQKKHNLPNVKKIH